WFMIGSSFTAAVECDCFMIGYRSDGLIGMRETAAREKGARERKVRKVQFLLLGS
ncbi:hypothetical protein A2U01_0054140, partial [Trifolium medium]|nr:hypothetical protein [Trifolium medium]